jgi:hypothetical protein
MTIGSGNRASKSTRQELSPSLVQDSLLDFRYSVRGLWRAPRGADGPETTERSERVMDQNTASWNRLVVWLRQLDALETTTLGRDR